MLIPAYKPLLKVIRSAKRKQIRVWQEEAASLLLGCFRHADEGIFKLVEYQGEHITIKEYAEAITSYIVKCSENERVAKIFMARSNQKPWITSTLSKE